MNLDMKGESIMSKLGKLLTAMLAFLTPALAYAEEGVAAAANNTMGLIAIAAGVGLGIAAGLAGLGQGIATAGGLQGVARNPQASGQIMTLMIIGLALIESLVIYAFVIAIMLTLKVNV